MVGVQLGPGSRRWGAGRSDRWPPGGDPRAALAAAGRLHRPPGRPAAGGGPSGRTVARARRGGPAAGLPAHHGRPGRLRGRRQRRRRRPRQGPRLPPGAARPHLDRGLHPGHGHRLDQRRRLGRAVRRRGRVVRSGGPVRLPARRAARRHGAAGVPPRRAGRRHRDVQRAAAATTRRGRRRPLCGPPVVRRRLRQAAAGPPREVGRPDRPRRPGTGGRRPQPWVPGPRPRRLPAGPSSAGGAVLPRLRRQRRRHGRQLRPVGAGRPARLPGGLPAGHLGPGRRQVLGQRRPAEPGR
jgi:hypothetical protein